ncbi:unnamed protein product, partial [Brugia timori]|uniref:Uncharacterized protein n=1 Tax=Brugia timori TaxID=42155 RepID=A0A0R3QZY1_9BILA
MIAEMREGLGGESWKYDLGFKYVKLCYLFNETGISPSLQSFRTD